MKKTNFEVGELVRDELFQYFIIVTEVFGEHFAGTVLECRTPKEFKPTYYKGYYCESWISESFFKCDKRIIIKN